MTFLELCDVRKQIAHLFAIKLVQKILVFSTIAAAGSDFSHLSCGVFRDPSDF